MQNFHVVWKPNPGGQERALTCPAFEALFHGPRGSGKSDVLLMDFASNVGKGYGADYRGLIVREATTELKDIIAKSMKYFPQLFPGAKFNGTTKVWTFPDGEYLWFNYAKMPSDYSQYHGAEFCVQEMSPVLGINGEIKYAKDVQVGDYLVTPQGNRRVKKVLHRVKPAVRISVLDGDSRLIGQQLQGLIHPVLTTDGWQRAGLSCLFQVSEQSVLGELYLKEVSQFLDGIHQESMALLYQFSSGSYHSIAVNLPKLYSCLFQIVRQFVRLIIQHSSFPEFYLYAALESGCSYDLYQRVLEISCTELRHERPQFLQLLQRSLSLMLLLYSIQEYHVRLLASSLSCFPELSVSLNQGLHQSGQRFLYETGMYCERIFGFDLLGTGHTFLNDISSCVRQQIYKELNLKYHYFDGLYPCDGQSLRLLGTVPSTFPLQSGVPQFYRRMRMGALDTLLRHNHKACTSYAYTHPYDRKYIETTLPLTSYETLISPCDSPLEMVDFEVETDNQYLTYAHNTTDIENSQGAFLINQNCYIGWEELTNHPTDEVYLMLMSCLRSSNKNIRLKYRANCNPGGVGAQWVKSRFIDTVPEGRVYQDEFGKTRAHVFLPTTENKVLLEATPDYQNTLKAMTEGNENLRKAWLYGSWDIFLGGFFSSVWEPKIHILKSKEFGNPFAPAFKIPASWRVQRSFDWGSARPWCVTYGAFCSGEQPEGLDFDIPVGSVVIIDEIYGWTGKPNEGDGATSAEITQRVLKRDKELEKLHSTYNEFTDSMRSIKIQPGPADNSIWNVIDGTSIGASMSKYGLYWQRSMKGHGSRKAGLATIRDMLLNAKKKDPEKPHLYFFQSAANHIRTIPIQQTSRFDPEDIDTDLEDHAIDSMRYLVARKNSVMKRGGVRM